MAVDFKDSQLNEVHFHELLEYKVITTTTAKLLQSCLTLCDPTDGSPPGSPAPGILQARTLEWVTQSWE